MSGQYFTCTTITRQTKECGPVACDVVVYFDVGSFSKGRPADLWGAAPHPEEPSEMEFVFVSAEFDGGEVDDAPGPLTEAEIAGLKTWLEDGAGNEKAYEAAEGYMADREEDDADRRYDEMRDRQMERDF
jgi:hypothetical protein